MKRNQYLIELIDSIKKTEDMISLHKTNNTSSLMSSQYEALKARQISELIGGLSMPPYQSVESISVVIHILSKFYPNMPEGVVKLKELKELEDAI